MAKAQRVFKGGKEYTITGQAKLERRVVFLNSVKIDGKEILLFRPVRKMKKQKDKVVDQSI